MSQIEKETDFLQDINKAMEHNQSEWKAKIEETEEKLKKAQMSADESKDEKNKRSRGPSS